MAQREDLPTSYGLMMEAMRLITEMMEMEGVTDDDFDARLNDFLNVSAEKMDRHRYVIREAEARAAQLRDEARRLTALARQFESTRDKVKDHAKTVLLARCEATSWDEGRSVKTDLGLVYLQRRQDVEIHDEDHFIEAQSGSPFVVWTEEAKIDRKALRQHVFGLPPDLFRSDLYRLVDKTSIVFK